MIVSPWSKMAAVAVVAASNGLVALAESQREPSNRPAQERPVERTVAPTQPNQPSPHLSSIRSLEGRWNVAIRLPSGTHESTADAPPDEITGTAERRWILDGTVLEERLRVAGGTMDRPSPQPGADRAPGSNQPAAQPRPGSPRDRFASYEGLGLFSYDLASARHAHIWADNMNEGMVYSMGTWDPTTRTLTYTRHVGEIIHDGDNRIPPGRDMAPPTPGSTGANRPEGVPPSDRNAGRGSGVSPESERVLREAATRSDAVVTVKIFSDDRHVVRMSRHGSGDEVMAEYEITYTRIGSASPAPR